MGTSLCPFFSLERGHLCDRQTHFQNPPINTPAPAPPTPHTHNNRERGDEELSGALLATQDE